MVLGPGAKEGPEPSWRRRLPQTPPPPWALTLFWHEGDESASYFHRRRVDLTLARGCTSAKGTEEVMSPLGEPTHVPDTHPSPTAGQRGKGWGGVDQNGVTGGPVASLLSWAQGILTMSPSDPTPTPCPLVLQHGHGLLGTPGTVHSWKRTDSCPCPDPHPLALRRASLSWAMDYGKGQRWLK